MIYLGVSPKSGKLLRDGGKGHVAVIAPTRSGKGVGTVVPTLLTWPESVVVMDFKAENYRLTAGRRKELGSAMLKFDPTSSDTCCFNPFDEIPLRTADEWGEVDNIATSLLDPRGSGKTMDSHWDRQGVGWLGAVLVHLLYTEPDKTLRGLANLIAGFEPNNRRGIIDTIVRMRDTRHTNQGPLPDVAREMQMMLDKAPNERSGVISTVQGYMKLYRDPHIAAATSRSDFRIADLMNHRQPVSLYLIIPVKDMNRLQPLLRLILNQVVKGLVPRQEDHQPRHRLLLMLDEFCVLGHMELLSQMLPFIAGYGIRACIVAQNLSQIRQVYGHNQSILQTCETMLALTPNRNDVDTANLLSEATSDTTVVDRHRSWNSGGQAISEQKIKRRLITAGEVLELSESKALIFKRGIRPILANRFRYHDNRQFDRWSKIPPPPQSDRLHEGKIYMQAVMEPHQQSSPPAPKAPVSVPAIEIQMPLEWMEHEVK